MNSSTAVRWIGNGTYHMKKKNPVMRKGYLSKNPILAPLQRKVRNENKISKVGRVNRSEITKTDLTRKNRCPQPAKKRRQSTDEDSPSSSQEKPH